MPLPRLVKFVLSWTGVGEIGQVGWYVQPQGNPSHDQLQAAADYMSARWAGLNGGAWGQIIRGWLSPDQSFTQFSVYDYATGKSPATDQAVSPIAPSAGVGLGAAQLPLQTAVCVSLLTGRPGASYRGRMYLPATGMPIGGHRFGHSELTQLALQIAGNDDAIPNNDVYGMLWDSERSLAGGSGGSTGAGTAVIRSVTKGIVTPITGVSVDDRPDTQRRRAESMAITYRATHGVARPVS